MCFCDYLCTRWCENEKNQRESIVENGFENAFLLRSVHGFWGFNLFTHLKSFTIQQTQTTSIILIVYKIKAYNRTLIIKNWECIGFLAQVV